MTGPHDMTAADTLERRCRRLLRFYPAAYRRERADEIIDTLLLSATPDQSWPGVRDAWSLITGGLRARAGADRRYSAAGNLRVAARLGVILFLADTAVTDFFNIYGLSATDRIVGPALAVATLAAATAVLLGFGRLGAGAVTAAGAAVASWVGAHPQGLDRWLLPVIAVAIALASRFRADPPTPRGWMWVLVAVLAIAQVWPTFGETMASPSWVRDDANLLSEFLLPALAVIWLAIDARLALAVAVVTALSVVESAGGAFTRTQVLPSHFRVDNVMYVSATVQLPVFVMIVVLVAAGGWRLRRQSVL